VKYQVTVAGRSIEVEVGDGKVVVDGLEVTADLVPTTEPGVWRVVVGTETRAVGLTRTGSGDWVIVTGGERLVTSVVDERTARARSMAGGANQASDRQLVTAPMPGLVLRLAVEEGAAVGVGAGLVVLEAMKMENEIRSSVAGVVRRIFALPGEAVEKGAPLVELGPPS